MGSGAFYMDFTFDCKKKAENQNDFQLSAVRRGIEPLFSP